MNKVVINTSITEGHKNREAICALGGLLTIMAMTGKTTKKEVRKMKSLLSKIDKRDQKIWDATLDQAKNK